MLFLDEPTSGLDPVSRRGLWDYLRDVRNADGTTIFLTTHYLEEAEEADRVCVIDHGRIAVIGTPDEMKRRAARPLGRARRRRSSGARGRAAPAWACARSPTRAARCASPMPTPPPRSSSPASATPLTVLRVHEPSLEEAYVELLRTNEEAVA